MPRYLPAGRIHSIESDLDVLVRGPCSRSHLLFLDDLLKNKSLTASLFKKRPRLLLHSDNNRLTVIYEAMSSDTSPP